MKRGKKIKLHPRQLTGSLVGVTELTSSPEKKRSMMRWEQITKVLIRLSRARKVLKHVHTILKASRAEHRTLRLEEVRLVPDKGSPTPPKNPSNIQDQKIRN